MPALVTGGPGITWSYVVRELLELGHDVTVLDNRHPIAWSSEPPEPDPRVRFVRGDVRDAETVRSVLDGIDHVCHQAAMVGLGVDLGDIADYVGHNDLGTAVLLRELAARSFGGRLVLASSMVVYGEGRYACTEHGVMQPGPRAVGDLDAGRFEPPCPLC